MLRGAFLVLGFLCVGVAAVGAFLPVVPTVPLVLAAGFFFSRSSERFDRWLLEHRAFGPIIRDWRAGRGFTVRAKTVAVLAIIASFGLTLYTVDMPTVGAISMVALAVGVCTYVLTRPTAR